MASQYAEIGDVVLVPMSRGQRVALERVAAILEEDREHLYAHAFGIEFRELARAWHEAARQPN